MIEFCGTSAARDFARELHFFPHICTASREGIETTMYAVIETGGKQYRVSEGDVLHLDTISAEAGTEVELGKVLMVSGENGVLTGADAAKLKVTGTVEKHGRAPKVIVFKFKRKKQYKRTQGHRQNYTQVKVTAIA
jgi:large subunit ribosomal protein L21